MKFIINPDYNYLSDYIKTLPQRFNIEGETIYTGRNHIKVMITPDGLTINIKRYHAPRGINSIIYSTGIRMPKGVRAFKYPDILLAKGINTPEAIAYIENRKMGLLSECYLITVQCPYKHTMYEFGDAPKGTYEECAKAFAHFTARMHDQEVLHLDYSPGNILWDKQGEDYLFSIVDINRMHFGPINMKQGCANLRRLWGPKQFFLIIVREYAKTRGFNPNEAEKIALTMRESFWNHFGKKHRIKFKLEL